MTALYHTIEFSRFRNWISSSCFTQSMSPVGPWTQYLRQFLTGDSGFTVVTCGYRGWLVREFPAVGLRATQKLTPMPFHEEIHLMFAKMYKMTKSDEITDHPILSTSYKPFLFLHELLSRSEDDRIATRVCNYTRVSFVIDSPLSWIHNLNLF